MKIDLEKLEKFYDGRMSNEEKNEFEEALQQDPSLSHEIRNYVVAKSAISNASNNRLKTHLDEIGKNMEIESYHSTSFVRYLLAAAGIALLGGIGWVMIHYFQVGKTSDEVFLSYYQRPDISEYSERSAGSDSFLIMWNDALVNYSNHEISKASGEFENLTKDQIPVRIPQVYFMQGICLMEMNEFEKAVAAFDRIGDESSFASQKQYYKALCFIKMGKTKEAIDLLNEIKQNRANPYRNNVRGLLRMLNKIRQ